MIAPLLLALCARQAQDAPIQKLSLPNGVVLYAEEMPKSSGFSLYLFVSSLGRPEPEGVVGQRHLLEHLLAKGTNRDLDAKLEVRGVSLAADTLRDGIRFEIEGPSDQLSMAIESLKELVTAPSFEKEEVEREVRVIEQEFALRSVSSRLTAALWEHAYGEEESDPYGSVAGLSTATPETLAATFAGLFKASSMTVTVVGDIDAGSAIAAMTSAFQNLDKNDLSERNDRKQFTRTSVGFASSTPGVGRAVFVPSFDHATTLAVLAAAFAISNEVNGAQMVYTPTPLGGLVSVVHPQREGLATVDGVIRGSPGRLFVIGRTALKAYFETIDDRSRDKARVYGQMLLLKRSFRIDSVKRLAASVTEQQFMAAVMKFHSSNAVRVGGTR